MYSMLSKAMVFSSLHTLSRRASMVQTMSRENINEYFEYAEQVVRKCGQILSNATDITNFEDKTSHSDIVTPYDRLIENTIIDSLHKEFPTHKFLAEETASLHKELTNDPTWVIDPIDGTLNFAHCFPFSCISLALMINKQAVLGIIYNPNHEEFFYAKRGCGAFLNHKRIHCSNTKDIKDALICSEAFLIRVHKKHEYRIKQIMNRCQGIRSLGSAALTLCYVACGALDGFEIEYTKIWDVAAGSIIVEEAGGVIKNMWGGPLNFNSPACVAAGTSILADTLIDICIDSVKQCK